MFAYDYPLLGAFWTVFFIAMWFTIAFTVIWRFANSCASDFVAPINAAFAAE